MKLRSLLALGPLLASGAAFAQVNLVITFDSPSTAVPLGGWSSIFIAMAIAALGAFSWRKKLSVHARAALVAIAAAVGVVALTEVREVVAAPITGFSLVTSPSTLTGVGSGTITVTNNSSTTITLRSIALSPAPSPYYLSGGTCAVGLVLAPLATCTVAVAFVNAG